MLIRTLVASLGLMLGCSANAQAQGTVRIGVLNPVSGSMAPYTLEIQPALEYMAAKINREGGIRSLGGAKLELILADTASQPASTAREARRLITQENVDLLIGALLTNDMFAVTSVVDEYKVPLVSIFSGATQSPYQYSIGLPYDGGFAATMVNFVSFLKASGIKVETAATSYSNYEGGQQINKFVKARLETIGVKVVADVPLDMKGQDLLASVLKLRSAAPDVVLGLQLQSNILALQTARFQVKYYDVGFVSSNGYVEPRIKRELGPELSREVLPRGIFGMALYAPSAKIAAAQSIAAELEQGADLKGHFGQYSVVAAQLMRVLQNALERAGSTDKEKLTAAIGQVKLPFGDPNLYLPLPDGLAFDDGHMVRNFQTLMMQWTQGADPTTEVVYPAQFATAAPRPFK